MMRSSTNIIGFQSSATIVQQESRTYLTNLLNSSDNRLFLSLRQPNFADPSNNVVINNVILEQNQIIVPDRSALRARRELYYQNLTRSIEGNSVVDRESLTVNSEHIFRSTNNIENVIVPIEINNLNEENLNHNSEVFIRSIRRPMTVLLDENTRERAQITNDVFPDYNLIEVGIRNLQQNLNQAITSPEINNFTRERLHNLINNLTLHRNTLIRNIDDHGLHYRPQTDIMSGLAGYEFDFVYQILELFTENFTSAGLATLGQIVNILRRPYVIQYFLVVLMPAVLNFTYLDLFNFRLNRLTNFFEGVLNALFGSQTILSDIQVRMSNLQRDLDVSLNQARLAVQATVSRNINRNVRGSNFWINLSDHIIAPLLRNFSTILGYFGAGITGGIIVYIRTRGTNSNVPTLPPFYPPYYPPYPAPTSPSAPVTDLAVLAAAAMSFFKDLMKFRKR
jgi:hypothetical protein